jgi:PAS domain S-box-containing protein
MNFDNLVRQVHGVRAQGDRFWREAERSGDPEVLLPAALEELGTALEELRVVEEEVRAQNSELLGANDRLREHRDRYRLLFDQAPVAYLVTDPFGVVTEANRRAAGLLGTVQRFLVGRPLTMFVPGDDRARFRQRLRELGRDGAAAWELRLQPRRGGPSPVAVTVEAFPGPGDAAAELRWALREVQPATLAPPPGKVSVPDWDSLAEALHEIIGAAIPLLRADGVGLMLADQQGALRWVTATNQAEQAFEQAERDLGEGPCIDAFTAGRVVSTSDLRADPRWPRLGPAARTNQIRGVLSAPGGARRPAHRHLQRPHQPGPDLDRGRRRGGPRLRGHARPPDRLHHRRPPQDRAHRPAPVRPDLPGPGRAGQGGPHGARGRRRPPRLRAAPPPRPLLRAQAGRRGPGGRRPPPMNRFGAAPTVYP